MSNNTTTEEKDLGFAGNLTKSFITSPLSIILFFAMLGAGIIGLISTPRQEDPQISVPLIDIFIKYPGASSKEVSNIIVKPLERRMSQILGVKHVYSVSDKGRSIITVEFDVGQDMNASIIKVRDKILSNLDFMPKGVPTPIIKPKEIDDVPIINLTLWSKTLDDGQLRALSMEVLQRLEQVENTNNGFIVGGRKEIFAVDIYPSRLASYGISLDEVASVIRNANVRQFSGNIELDSTHLNVYSGSFLQKVSDIENLVVSNVGNKPIYIRDVANVSHKTEETSQMVTHYSGSAKKYQTDNEIANGEQAVTIAVAKKFGTNGVKVSSDILKKVEELKGTLIPKDVNIEVSRDYGKSAKNKVNALIKKLFIATGAVTILVFLALGWRPALVVTLGYPCCATYDNLCSVDFRNDYR
jgi:multidrug efflux pump subunit AcrB